MERWNIYLHMRLGGMLVLMYTVSLDFYVFLIISNIFALFDVNFSRYEKDWELAHEWKEFNLFMLELKSLSIWNWSMFIVHRHWYINTYCSVYQPGGSERKWLHIGVGREHSCCCSMFMYITGLLAGSSPSDDCLMVMWHVPQSHSLRGTWWNYLLLLLLFNVCASCVYPIAWLLNLILFPIQVHSFSCSDLFCV